MLDCELDLGGNNIWGLIYWDLVDWGIVLLLLLLLGFLLFLRRHRPVSVYNYRLVSFLVLIITQIPQLKITNPLNPPTSIHQNGNKFKNNGHYKFIKSPTQTYNKSKPTGA